jgi:serine/threonine protein kinase/Tol biopolymer transport system component
MERIAHYRLIARLGSGAMGEVWRALDERLGREVALKLLSKSRAADEEMQARLLREAQAASALNHPGIVTVHDVGAWQGQVFMVMELVDGESFAKLARRGIEPLESLRLVAEAADALQVAHERHILHRDVKGDNLMRTRDGRVKVLDFGLAKLRNVDPLAGSSAGERAMEPDASGVSGASGVGASALDVSQTADLARTADLDSAETMNPIDLVTGSGPTERRRAAASPRTLEALHQAGALSFPALSSSLPTTMATAAGQLVGTPAYLAPEQTDGTPGDACSEVWSLGIVLYELLVGKRPFDALTVEGALPQIRRQPIVPPTEAVPDRGLPPLVDGLIAKALARDRMQRYPDMAAFAEALRAARRRLGADSGPQPVFGRRYAGRAAMVGMLLLVAAAAVALAAARRWHPPVGTPATARMEAVPVGHGGPVAHGTRRVTFAAGCEEYPSFTPDGRALVYDGLVDGDYELMALDLPSGRPRRLTHEKGWDYGSNISPDGKHVAYVHTTDLGRELRLLPLAGAPGASPTTLGTTAGGFPSWTRDGAIVAGDGERIYRWATDGSAGRRLLTVLPSGSIVRYVVQSDSGDLAAVWVPPYAISWLVVGEIPRGGVPRIVEQRLPYDTVGVTLAPSQTAYYYGLHHSDVNELVRRRFGGAAEPVLGGIAPASGLTISTDGKQLAYSTCRDSSLLVRLRPNQPPQELAGRGSWRDYCPAPVDARRVVFQSDRSGSVQIWLLDLGSGETRPLSPAGASRPSVSPDGRWVAWTGGSAAGIHVARIDGDGDAQPTRLTDGNSDGEPSFASDGRTLVFGRTREGEGARVYAVPLAGGSPRPLSPVGAAEPMASPTDDRVVFSMPVAHGRVLMVTDLAGRAPKPLPLPAGDWGSPRFSRDGKKLLLTRKLTDVYELELGSGRATVVYHAGVGGVSEVAYPVDGDGWLAAVQSWDGDIWIADGDFN